MMRRLWWNLRTERPITAGCLVFMGLMLILSGATSSTTSTIGRWLSAGLVVGGVIYVVVFSTLFVLARRDRKRRPVGGHAGSSHD